MPRVEEIHIGSTSKRKLMVVTLDMPEMALVLFEAMVGLRRPDGVSTEEALDTVKQHNPALHEHIHRCAQAAMDYVADRMKNAQPEQVQ
jgi:hypothetical protein